MALEEAPIRPESAEDSCEEEESDTGSEEIDIPEWSLNAWTFEHISNGALTYNAEDQSCVWPPMLLVVAPGREILNMALGAVRETLGKEGIQADAVRHTESVCGEGEMRYDLFVLPATGLSYVAAKTVDGYYYLEGHNDKYVYYPSLKDMIDIKNGRVPESSRQYIENLCYHGMAREAWNDLGVDLIRGDGICVGRGVCQKFNPSDCVDGEALDESHVGVQVMVVNEDLVPADWKDSLRRWRTTHALHNGVSLFERLRQHEGEAEHDYCEDGLVSSIFNQAQGVLRDQALTSVAPWLSISEDDDGFGCLSEVNRKTCQDAIHDIEERYNSRSDGKPLEKKFKVDEMLRTKELEDFIAKASTKWSLMEHLVTANGSHMARGVMRRLKDLHKLNQLGSNSTLVSSMIKGAEDMELSTLSCIKVEVEREEQRINVLGGFESEREKLILKKREEQHQELLKLLTNTEASQLSKVEEFVADRFRFVDSVENTQKETESIVDWLAQHTARATDKVKRVHSLEKKKWEGKVARVEKKLGDKLAKAEAELQVARRELEEHKSAIPKCTICFESLEGAVIKPGTKRGRDHLVLRQRACFFPCMHTNMCVYCSYEAWEKYRRCPMCNTPSPRPPPPIFM